MTNNFISMENFLNSINKQENISKRVLPKAQNNNIVNNKPSAEPQTILSLSTEVKKAKQKNGLVERLFDYLKGLTGIGISSKKLQNEIDTNQNEEKIKTDIINYRKQQENIAQTTGDIVSAGAAIGGFFKVKQFLETWQGRLKINTGLLEKQIKELNTNIDELANTGKAAKHKETIKKAIDFAKKHIDKRHTAIVGGMIAATMFGAITKYVLLKLNRTGSGEFKAEITPDMDKKAKKAAKKAMAKQRKNANFRNFVSGAINGLMTPILAFTPLVTAPLYLIGNSLSKYFIANREDNGHKTVNGYVENIKNSYITHAVGAAAILIPAIKKGRANKIFEKNIDKVVEKLKTANLQDLNISKTAYGQLEDVMFTNDKIANIINDLNLSDAQKIQALSDENIFSLKFKQIQDGTSKGFFTTTDPITKALKESCPPTRSLADAQTYINKTFTNNEYTIERLCGVGTIAETYLAKDKSGKEVCIKILKDGINPEKILKDKEAFINIIKGMSNKSEQEKDYLIKNFENIAEGVLKELDFNNEMKAANALREVTKEAKLVKPILCKDNIYVMEKADGISLKSLLDYISKSEYKKGIQKNIESYKDILAHDPNDTFSKNQLEKAVSSLKEIEEIEKTSNIGEITKKEAKQLLKKYQDILIEQFNKVDKKGKLIHADIHDGNIFIDINAMRRGEKNFMTLIDTGNTIEQTKDMAIRYMFLSKYIKNADVENITKFILDGAKLPEGMTQEKAYSEVSNALKKIFFDSETRTDHITNDKLMSITDSIFQKLNIIPSDTHGTLQKAKQSANTSLNGFTNTFWNHLEKQLDESLEKGESKAKLAFKVGKVGSEFGIIQARKALKTKFREWLNLFKLSPKERITLKRSASTPDFNSEEFLTYRLKPWKISDSKINKALDQLDQLD